MLERYEDRPDDTVIGIWDGDNYRETAEWEIGSDGSIIMLLGRVVRPMIIDPTDKKLGEKTP